MHRFAAGKAIMDYNSQNRASLKNIFGMLEPKDCDDYRNIRIGRQFDGGYIMKQDFIGVDAAYSLGINDDVSWDLDIASMGIDIYQYDHTIEALPARHPRFHWIKAGISDVSDKVRNYMTLEQAIQSNGHSSSYDLVLKCDIECHEIDVFANAEVETIARFRQIVVEIHALHEIASKDNCEIIRSSISKLTRNHNLVHVHANNWAPWAIVGAIPIPTVLEITLLRKDRGTFTMSNTVFPTEMDMPCNPAVPDYMLGKFRY